MRTFDGYIKQDGGDNNVLLDGGGTYSRSNLVKELKYSDNKITWTKADGSAAIDLVDLTNVVPSMFLGKTSSDTTKITTNQTNPYVILRQNGNNQTIQLKGGSYTTVTGNANGVVTIDTDLSGYATKNWVELKKYLTSHRPIKINGTEQLEGSSADALDIAAGTNITLTWDATNKKVTISSADDNTWQPANTSQEGYVPKLVNTETNAVSNNGYVLVYESSETGTVVPKWRKLPSTAFSTGTNNTGTVTSITPGDGLLNNASNDAITSSGILKVALTNYTKNSSASNKSTSSSGGLYAVELDKDGKLAVRVPWTDSHYTTGLYVGKNDTKANAETTNGNTYLKLYDNSTKRAEFKITGSTNVSVTSDASGNITITGPKLSDYMTKPAAVGGTLQPIYWDGSSFQTCTVNATGLGNAWGFIPNVDASGVMEIGRYVDFHKTSNDGIDYAVRLTIADATYTSTNKYSQILQAKSGTIALTSEIPTKASWNYDDVYLKLAGGTVTGKIDFEYTHNLKAADNGVTTTQYPTTFNILDTNNLISARLENVIGADGGNGFFLYARNYNTSGTLVAQKGIKLIIDKSGTGTWTVNEPASFRTAISAVTGSISNGTITINGTSINPMQRTSSNNVHDNTGGLRVIGIANPTSDVFSNKCGSVLQWSNTDKEPSTADQSTWYNQLIGLTDDRLYFRTRTNGGNWTSLHTIAYTSEIPTKSSWDYDDTYLKLTGGTLTGGLVVQKDGIWVQGGSNAGNNTSRMSLTNGMPDKFKYNSSQRGVFIYSNAIAFADPCNGNSNNDASWIRHIEETANSGVLEIAVGDDGSYQEQVHFRTYNTSSEIVYDSVIPKKSGTIALTSEIPTNVVKYITLTSESSTDFNFPDSSARYGGGIYQLHVKDSVGTQSNKPFTYGMIADFETNNGHLQFAARANNDIRVRSYWWTGGTGFSYPDWQQLIHSGNISNNKPKLKWNSTLTIGTVGSTDLQLVIGNDEGTSNFTDGTELLTSYASNNGFADTNAAGIIYRRKASCMWNYINGKLSLGVLNPETGRTSARGNLYTYNTNYTYHDNAPTTYSSVIGFGRNTSGQAEICVQWTAGDSNNAAAIWFRALRDTTDNWYGWTSLVPHKKNLTNINGLSGSFMFSGTEGPFTGTDWVGLQVEGNNDKGQLSWQNGTLVVRQNDTGGTDSSNWTDWATVWTNKNLRSLNLQICAEDSIKSSSDLNDILTPGTYYCQSGAIASTLTNTPYTAGNFRLFHIGNIGTSGSTSQWSNQLLVAPNQAKWFTRGLSDGTFTDWYEFITTSNMNNYIPTIIKSGYITSGTASLSSYWCKAWEITITSYRYNDCDVTFYIQSAYNQWRGFLHLRIRQNGENSGGAYSFSVNLVESGGNIPKDRIRLYYNNSTGNCQLWFNCVSQYSVYNISIIKKTWRTGTDVASMGTLYSTSFTSAQTFPSTGYSYIEASYASTYDSVNYATSAGSTTSVIVNQHTSNDTNYPLVWSNQCNGDNVTANQLFKSWSDLYYNPKNKRLVVGGIVTATSFYTSSDIRLKTNITPISDSIYSFNWKESGKKSYGFIAQYLEENYPELVSGENSKSVDYNAAICLVIAKLENRIKELEDKLNG